MSKFLPAVCAFGLLSSSVLAQEKSLEQLDQEGDRIWGTEGLQKYQFTRIVPSGANQRIEFLTALNPDCTSSGDINLCVTNQPEHGKVEITPTSHFPRYSKDSDCYRCTQHKVKGVLVNYKAEKIRRRRCVRFTHPLPRRICSGSSLRHERALNAEHFNQSIR